MSTAEELLCSRKWRFVHGLWMLWGILSFGLLACVGWLYIGIKSKRWWIIGIGVGLLASTILYFTLSQILPDLPGKGESMTDAQRAQSSSMGGFAVGVWVASSVGAWFVNRKWLVWRAHNNATVSQPWYQSATAGGSVPPPYDPRRVGSTIDNAFAMGATTSGPATPTAIDLNTATAEQLAALPGFDAEMATQIISTRAQGGAFRDTTDLVSRAGVKPHIFAGVQGRIVVGGSTSTATSVGPAAQPNSVPENGRRLEF